LSELCKGAKDSSNFQVAGYVRNFSQDSSSELAPTGRDNDWWKVAFGYAPTLKLRIVGIAGLP